MLMRGKNSLRELRLICNLQCMATQFESAIMRLLIEQDLYKEGESDTFKTPNQKWQIKVEKTENGWLISERICCKDSEFKEVAEGNNLSKLVRNIFKSHLISY